MSEHASYGGEGGGGAKEAGQWLGFQSEGLHKRGCKHAMGGAVYVLGCIHGPEGQSHARTDRRRTWTQQWRAEEAVSDLGKGVRLSLNQAQWEAKTQATGCTRTAPRRTCHTDERSHREMDGQTEGDRERRDKETHT